MEFSDFDALNAAVPHLGLMAHGFTVFNALGYSFRFSLQTL
jgi:hypothetical protein